MEPIKGIVIKTGPVLTVRLYTRALVEVPRHPQLRLGDTAYVLYDYTRMQVNDVWTEEEFTAHDDVSGGIVKSHLPLDEYDPDGVIDPTSLLGFL